jgi:tetratricopeptide (TPR) repeat protein
VIEDTMFFPKLRRHAKWMFVFLALVFGLGFVIFGVGSDVQGGLGDLFRGSGVTSDAPSVEEAQERVAEQPRNAEALRDLANALTADARTDEAIDALTRYTALRTRDEDALRELAGLYLQKANRLQGEAELVQERVNYLTAGTQFGGALQLPGGGTLGQDPILQAVATKANEEVSSAYGAAQAEYRRAADTYDKVVQLSPRDPNIQLELGQTAQRAGDFARAVAAYETFLRLAPDDP